MDTVATGAVLTAIIGLGTWWIKSSVTNLITGLTNAVNENTKAINLLTTDYKVQDEKLATINHTLTNHASVHKLLDASIDELGKEVNGVKTQVGILVATSGGNNGHSKG